MSNLEWKKLLSYDTTSDYNIRGTEIDSIFLGLYLDNKSKDHITNSEFDGFYTYFASDSFTYGSNPNNWNVLNEWSRIHNLIFIPSLGPGYIDTRIRPWNDKNTKARDNGYYYKKYFDSVINVNKDIENKNKIKYISITSFNEWHEGTQIENAKEYSSKNTGFKYENYGNDESFYMSLTYDFGRQFMKSLN